VRDTCALALNATFILMAFVVVNFWTVWSLVVIAVPQAKHALDSIFSPLSAVGFSLLLFVAHFPFVMRIAKEEKELYAAGVADGKPLIVYCVVSLAGFFVAMSLSLLANT